MRTLGQIVVLCLGAWVILATVHPWPPTWLEWGAIPATIIQATALCLALNPSAKVRAKLLWATATGKQAQLEVETDLWCAQTDGSDVMRMAEKAVRTWRPNATTERRDPTVFMTAGARFIRIERKSEDSDTGDEDTLDHIRVQLRGIETNVGRLDHVLDTEIRELLEALRRTIRPIRGKYAVHVDFGGTTPLAGLYVQDTISANALRGFTVAVQEKVNDVDASVRIDQRTLSAVSAEPYAAIRAARKALGQSA